MVFDWGDNIYPNVILSNSKSVYPFKKFDKVKGKVYQKVIYKLVYTSFQLLVFLMAHGRMVSVAVE